MNYRSLRLANLIRDELAELFLRTQDFNGALVTITDITIDPKLGSAHVGISVLPETAADHITKQLNKSAGELQFAIVRKINIKPMPRISFFHDRGPENSATVEKRLLQEHNKD